MIGQISRVTDNRACSYSFNACVKTPKPKETGVVNILNDFFLHDTCDVQCSNLMDQQVHFDEAHREN